MVPLRRGEALPGIDETLITNRQHVQQLVKVEGNAVAGRDTPMVCTPLHFMTVTVPTPHLSRTPRATVTDE